MTTTSLSSGDVYSGDGPGGDRRLTAGAVIADKYEIVSFLGAGGMGSVWRAHSRALDVDVAVKILHRDENGTGERLHREARATAQIGHPAIVRALDFGTMNTGELFLVMEYLEGRSLAEWIQQHGPMPAAKAVPFLLPIADGLAAAHARGIVHRDVKPDNIIVVRDRNGADLPKIVDFGIAKMDPLGDAVITQEGALIGSPLYMAPEQAMGEPVTPQADVWALAVVLYELVTGRPPFQAPTTAGVLVAVQTRPPRPAPELAGDAQLWAILQRGLRKSREGRWPTMRAFGQALAAWALARGIVTDAMGASIEHAWMDKQSGDILLDLAPCSEDTPSDLDEASPPSLSMYRTLPSNVPSNRTTQAAPVVHHEETPAPRAPVTDTLPSAAGPRRAFARGVMGLLAGLASVLVLGAGGFYARAHAVPSAHVGSAPVLAAALVAGPPAEPVPAAPPSPAATPEAVAGPAPQAAAPETRRAPTAATTSSARAARGTHKAPARLPKALAQAMPLPASPDY